MDLGSLRDTYRESIEFITIFYFQKKEINHVRDIHAICIMEGSKQGFHASRMRKKQEMGKEFMPNFHLQ